MNIIDWAVNTMGTLGGPGVALLLLLECVFPPIPSEVILPLGGVSAGRGEHTYIGILIWSVIGSVLGAYILYGIGRALGPERTREIFIRLPLINAKDFQKTDEFMQKHGKTAVFLGRFIPGIRSLISVPAGMFAMPFGVFTLLTAAGSAIWNAIFIAFGYYLGSRWQVIEPYTDIFSKVCYVLVVLVCLWILVKLIMRERKRRAAGLPDPDEKHLEELKKDQ
ncbi:DedA family protein [Helcobacillus massiliensis]|uniref:Membrane protein DedA with SNARE-associated domain n=1 Tax=Helcobacillus massiliensis TaxID=521392 RepID=A0A839QUA1_9MICO|nr:DedA family protein [Helcobacillus massiliensis]MCG7428045.1 DedA family protein [Helcobacillus sp. ACRRO]MBB3023218.1 membrane protein DedA with SNARE-associated domain [Helcobacillus massiliensis]MCT1556606.1 DedA family protein [Helcobacillus massiliensis]MCT2035800.1 DedA family protein [Helcobacillus massiliensis]MCT2331118.1 DedA family protein [Helcobacillus massiliensis]